MTLRKAAARGAVILSAASFSSGAMSFVCLVVLARFITPHQFGQVALAVAIAEILFVVANWSLGTALIREPEESVRDAFDAAVALLLVLAFALLLLASCLVALLVEQGDVLLAELFAVVVVGRVFSLASTCFSAELDRALAFGRLAILQTGAFMAGWGIALALGVAGFGVWALSLRELGAGIVAAVFAYVMTKWRPRWKIKREKVRELARFGAFMSVSRLGDIVFSRFDNLMVGLFAGTTQLGLYNHAYSSTEAANRVYLPILSYVPLPAYSRLRDDRARMSSAFRIVTYVITRTVLPLGVVLILFPREAIVALFGQPWAGAAVMLPWLSSYAMLLPLYTHMREVLVAQGAVRDVLRARLAQLVVFVPCVVVLAAWRHGQGAAMAVCVAMLAGTAMLAVLVRRSVDYQWRSYVAPLLAAGASGAVSWPLRGGEGVGRFALDVGVVVVAYALALAALEGRALLEHVSLVVDAAAPRRGARSIVYPAPRQFLFAASVTLACILVGAAVALLPTGPGGLFVVVIVAFAALLALAVRLDARLSGDALSLLSLSALFFALSFVGGGTYLWFHKASGPSVDHHDLLVASTLGAVGWLGFSLGYLGDLLRVLRRVIPQLPAPPSGAGSPRVIVMLLSVGWLARLVLVRDGAYFHTGGDPASGARLSPLTTIGASLPLVAVACIGAEALGPNGSRGRRWLFAALTVLEAIWAIPSGSRGAVVNVVVMLAVVRYYAGTPLSRRWLAAAAAFVVFVIFPFGAAYRGDNVTYRTSTKSSLDRALTETFAQSNPTLFLTRGYTAAVKRFADVDALAVIVDQGRHPLGSAPWSSLLWAGESFIPRVILPDKTDTGTVGAAFAIDYRFSAPGPSQTSVAMTQVGELYLDFGTLGVAVGMLFVGALYRLINDYFSARRGSALVLALYAATAGALVSGEETILALGLVGVLKTAILIWLLLILLARGVPAVTPERVRRSMA